ncbi:MAG: toxin-antitoxin system YwqK family antitoxin [Bacteroidales bacterium]|nr:toxin-antitoxin system YwqK family antitoxin [Bacteroidales bacterium]
MKSLIKILVVVISQMSWMTTFSQEAFNPDGYNIFYHTNGNISSEGTMRNGKPDGYWKTYHENGIIKSEGNRVDFELDSVWTFYDETGDISLEISYKAGVKDGIRKTYRVDEIIVERFVKDVKTGLTEHFFTDGALMRTIPFENGLEQGNGFEYDHEGNIITLIEYRRGFIINRESINRHDHNGLKQGRWKYFYDDGALQMEGTFRNGKRDGFFKTYDRNGNLLDLKKFVNDEEIIDAPEIFRLEVVTEYYETGVISRVTTYRNNLPEGVSREYAEDGSISEAIVYAAGNVIGKGIIDEEGNKEGDWEDYYIDGSLRAQGTYKNNKKTGEWIYYHENGTLEQKGTYDDEGKPVGEWVWYYDNGNLWREELFINGLQDGLVTEFDPFGKIISEGEYFEGLEEGKWIYNFENHKIEGSYSSGRRNGVWKHYYSNGQLSFEGQFIDDNPNGKHIYYWEDGNKKDEEEYIMGRKEGDWIRYNEDGTPLLVITYSNNREVKYDGVKIKPEFDE